MEYKTYEKNPNGTTIYVPDAAAAARFKSKGYNPRF